MRGAVAGLAVVLVAAVVPLVLRQRPTPFAPVAPEPPRVPGRESRSARELAAEQGASRTTEDGSPDEAPGSLAD